MEELEVLLQKSINAKPVIANLSTEAKNQVLHEMSREIVKNKDKIINANKKDYEKAKQGGLSKALLDRLLLNDKRIEKMADAIQEIAALPDPVGEIVTGITRPNGLRIRQVRVPIGVILIVYEARPNVTTDAAGLTFKSGNAAVLRGGANSFNSNQAIVQVLQDVLKKHDLPEEIITFIPRQERELLIKLLKYNQYIDLLIPRGGASLINMVVSESRIPVVFHADGICHVFVDETAQKDMTESIVINAKTQRPGVCNAVETLLVHKDYAYTKGLIELLLENKVELRGDNKIMKLNSSIKQVSEDDWRTEYLDMILSVKIVDTLDDAIFHINHYGSHHSDAIITENYSNSEKFLKQVDSSSVFVNASTRFADGGEYGLGAEIGISTQKLHARGPMGLKDLTSKKYIVYGEGQVRK